VPKDMEIERAAQGLIERHGAKAALFAKFRVEACERDGNREAATIWRRIVEMIQKLLNSPPL